MGKRYYCDYCDRAFPDSAQNRKKHLQGVNHQKRRKEHYDYFRDAATVLKEELSKKPCRKYIQEGFCQYECSCKYSHMTPDDIENLKKKAALEEQQIKEASKKAKPEFDVDAWLKTRLSKKEKVDKSINCSVSLASNFPAHLFEIVNLTPSIIPPQPEDFFKCNVAEWES